MPETPLEDADPDGSRIFFMHVMKTGGTTLLETLRRTYRDGGLYPDPDLDYQHDPSQTLAFRPFTIRQLAILPEERKRQIRVLTGHFPLVAREVLGGRFRTVTILRDPIDRTISLLRQAQRPASWSQGRQRPPERMTLDEIYELPHLFEPLVHNHQTKLLSMTLADEPTGFMQQIDVDEERLRIAKDQLAALEVIGLTERYEELLDLVADQFGWMVPRGLRANAAPDADGPHVSESLRRRIAEDNAFDVDLYRYAVDLVDARRAHRRTGR